MTRAAGGGGELGARRADWHDWVIVCAIGAMAAGVWVWFGLSTRIALEDAFITYRYARNLAMGLGFVYNAGERVLGTTTPLQTILLAAVGVVLGPERVPATAAVVMPVFGLAALGLAYLALTGLGVARVGAAAGCLLFALHPLVVRTSLGGMETPLVLLLMGLALFLASRRRGVGVAAVAGLLALCRADGLIWGAMIVGATLISGCRRPARQALALGAIVVPWIVFAWVYFGSPLPNSMLAKGVVRPGREGLLLDPLHVRRLAAWYLSGTGLRWDQPVFPVWIALVGFGAYAAVRNRRRELWVVAAFPAVYVVLMYLGRAPMYQWYLLPMLFCCLLLGGMGAGQVASWLGRGRVDWRLRAAAGAATVGLLAVGMVAMAGDLPAQVRHARRFQRNEVGLRKTVGLWLRDHTPRGASVAMEAIGYQGYYSERRIIDMAGLVTPRVVELKASTGSNAVLFKRIITELRPDYIVLRSFEVDENRHFNGGKLFDTPRDRAEFFEWHREAQRFAAPHPELGPLITHITVYERRGTRSDHHAGRMGAARAQR